MPILKKIQIRRKGTNQTPFFQYFNLDTYDAEILAISANWEVIGSPIDEEVTNPVSPVVPISGGVGGAIRVDINGDDLETGDPLDTSLFVDGQRRIFPDGSVEYWYNDAWSTDTGIGDFQIQ